MLKLAKFGGTSVASAQQFKKVAAIVSADSERRYVVVSAPGKRFATDNKITDLLLLVNAHILYHVDCTALLETIKQRYVDIAQELKLSYPIAQKFDEFALHVKDVSPEYIVSRGEWFTARFMAELLDKPFVDAADVIRFHHDGSLNQEATAELLQHMVAQKGSFVLPGFYGATSDGKIKLFERGGGDITGAVVARALSVQVYENWTDVSGFLAADPRIVDNPRTIHRITYNEMRELSYMDASVLQEEAIFPVREANIPIQIKNTNDPKARGTMIRETAEERASEHLITGVAGRKNFTAVHIQKAHMSSEVGFIRRALSVFERYHVSVEHVPTGIDSFGIVVNGADVCDTIYSLVTDLQTELQPDSIQLVEHLALISVVGRNISRRAGTSGRIFGVLGEAGVNIRMITQSSQEISIILGVNNEDFDTAIRVLYDRFVKSEMVCVTSE